MYCNNNILWHLPQRRNNILYRNQIMIGNRPVLSFGVLTRLRPEAKWSCYGRWRRPPGRNFETGAYKLNITTYLAGYHV